ncbi:MAG: DUF515 domain-containing protein [Euryarchaeota archaeon]|nr:DUF515 domain-containing protein [Euryarchaeota archaeon]MBU4606941.1 DUF515 domain-containing protein [Euryarchaeota archaeon]MBV1729256.1 DUF515 domain-containing protein [Methanobacterium sp.]MBV1754662.1 DUF515 domain-containing protein [Methanobacterium sp.]
MLDKLKGSKKKNNKDSPPDLRKNGEKESSDVGSKIQDLVGKISGKANKSEEKTSRDPAKKARPMPKPRIKPKGDEKIRLKPKDKPKKPVGAKGGSGGGPFGRKMPDDDQRTIIGAAVFGLILIILVASGYYFLVYAPYQETLQDAKATKLNEINAYFKGPLAVDPEKQALLADIDAGVTPEQVLSVDVIGPATNSWRTYQNQQLSTKKDTFDRVMIVYSTDPSVPEQAASGSQKNVIMKASEAQRFISQADATVLANMEIQTPDTVAVPIMISRLQAAGGLISVGNMVDVYLRVSPEEEQAPAPNETEEGEEAQPAQTTQTPASSTPQISGATVLAILRAKDSGTIDARVSKSQSFSVNELISQSQREQTSSADVEQLLRAAASGGFNEAETRALLQNYGIKLSDFERTSNLGELDAQYLLLLEVPRENVLFLIQNMDSIILTVPTQQAPNWMINELKTIYG